MGPISSNEDISKRLDDCAWEGDAADEPPDAELQYNTIYREIESLAQTRGHQP